jgi:polygalacturonase
VVPQNKSYHLKPVTFSGPCKSNFTFKVICLLSLYAYACIYTSLYIHIHIRQLTYILLIVCLILKVFVFLYFFIQVYGTIKASPRKSDYQKHKRKWLVFQNIQNFTVEGGGTINGNGKRWWNNSCKVNKSLVYIYV